MSEWKRRWALRNYVPIRFLDRWAGCGDDLFHGLPTKAMRAWIEQGERT